MSEFVLRTAQYSLRFLD